MLKGKHVRYACVDCGFEQSQGIRDFCPQCSGMMDVNYALGDVRLYDSGNPLERYFDLLPIEDPSNLLPIDLASTACVHATSLGRRYGMPALYFKDETALPTRSTKDRMAAVVLSLMKECGVFEFGVSSTGNSSTALAYLVSDSKDFRLRIFTGESFVSRVQHTESERVHHYSLMGGSFVDAAKCAIQFARERGLQPERGFFNPGRREGLKLAGLEAFEQLPQGIDYYVQAVSSAMGVFGVYRGAQQFLRMGKIDRLPRLVCVQQQSCQPMVSAYDAGSPKIRPEDIVLQPQGIGSAILRGDPSKAYPYIRSMVIESEGQFVSVSEREIREARTLMEDEEGLSPCFTAAAAFAGLVKRVQQNQVDRGATVLVNLTGGDRTANTPAEMPVPIRRSVSGNGWEIGDL